MNFCSCCSSSAEFHIKVSLPSHKLNIFKGSSKSTEVCVCAHVCMRTWMDAWSSTQKHRYPKKLAPMKVTLWKTFKDFHEMWGWEYQTYTKLALGSWKLPGTKAILSTSQEPCDLLFGPLSPPESFTHQNIVMNFMAWLLSFSNHCWLKCPSVYLSSRLWERDCD